MDIMHYREFIELANRLNFHEAAKALNMSQSSLSKHILSLEALYGTQLLDRGKRRVALTEAGSVFLEQALKIWEAYEESIAVMSVQRKTAQLKITGLIDSPDEYYNMSRVFVRMQEKGSCRLRTLSCQSVSPRHLADLVLDGECDCAISYLEPEIIEQWADLDRFVTTPICRRPIDAIVSSGSKLARKESLDPADLAGATFVHLTGPLFTPIWKLIESKVEAFGIPYTTRPQMVSNVYDYVDLDLGRNIMLMPRKAHAIEIRSNPRYKIIPIDDGDFFLDLHALRLAGNDDPALEMFVETMREVYEGESLA